MSEIKQEIKLTLDTKDLESGAKKVNRTAENIGKGLQSASYGFSGLKGTALNAINAVRSESGDYCWRYHDCYSRNRCRN